MFDTEELRDKERNFTLSPKDYKLINPNTRTCPIFRKSREAHLARQVYTHTPILEVEGVSNPWQAIIKRQFNIADDAHLLRTKQQLEQENYHLHERSFINDTKETFVAFFEAKMIYIYDHRYATFADVTLEDAANGQGRSFSIDEYLRPVTVNLPRYWVPKSNWRQIVPWQYTWTLGFRWFTNATNERTFITTIIPDVACGDTLPCIYLPQETVTYAPLLLANLSSFVFDFFARQKTGGTHMNFFILKQLP